MIIARSAELRGEGETDRIIHAKSRRVAMFHVNREIRFEWLDGIMAWGFDRRRRVAELGYSYGSGGGCHQRD